MEENKSTKEKILATALDLFSKNGFADSSIRMIAREVGIRESAIYNHFKSKEEILQKLIKTRKNIDSNLLDDELLNELSNPHVFLKKFSGKLLERWNTEEEIKFFRLSSIEKYRDANDKKIFNDNFLGEIKSVLKMIFTELIKHKVIIKIEPELLVDEFLAILLVLRAEYLHELPPVELKKINTKLVNHVNFFWNAVKM
ncbi:MAG: TetR/AcrR family transcriptional regulator [Ignavibacteria bacterium]|jgi:AcrR family transcriptional regulator